MALQTVELSRRSSHRDQLRLLSRWRCLSPCCIALLALVLRLHGLGDKPFWLDEIASLRRSTLPLPDIIGESLRSNHYPAYFLLLWAVAKFGTSQFLLRLPSAIFGALGAGLVCAIGQEADGSRTGIAAGLLLALSPFAVQLGQEARSYTLVACLILVAMWGLVRLARDPAAAGWRCGAASRSPPAAWLAYAIGTAAALDVLNVAVPWLAAANLAAIFIAHGAGPGRRDFLRNWAIAQAIILAAWLPWLVALYVVSDGGILDAVGWVPPVTMAGVWSVAAPVYLQRISAFVTFDLLPAAVPGLACAIVGLTLWGAWRLRREPRVLVVLSTAGVVIPLLLLLASFYKPLLVPRYFAWSAAPFLVLAGAGLGRLPASCFAGAATALATACLINLLPYYHDETKPRWDLAASALAAAVHDGDVVLLNSWYAHYVMTAYAERTGLIDRHPVLTWNPAEAAALPPRHDLWVVLGRTGQAPLPAAEAYLDRLARLGRPIEERQIGRYITMWRFAPATVAATCGTAAMCAATAPATAKR